jgi:hypothetical protein
VTETTAIETPRKQSAQIQAKPGMTSIAVRVVYGLGLLAATVLAASLVFVAVAWAASGDGEFGIDIALPALVLWIALIGIAAGTLAVRRRGRPR